MTDSATRRDALEGLIVVEGLDAFYGQAQVLFDVSLRLRAGEICALIGRNGAGKTTTLKAIMGLVERRARALTWRGQDIRNLPTHVIARDGLGFVPEERRIFTDLTVAENLEVGRQPARGGRQPWTPDRLVKIFPNLAEMMDRSAARMSGGEQQMLTIARTLMGNPDAVLLDEPSEGLSPLIVSQMGEAVRAMKAQGIAVLLSEQNLHFAATIADRVLVMETGNVRHDGPMAEFLADTALREKFLAV
ncbi:MAG TPA: ABC transporter ATP-binding protein [Hyphomicrobiaceae bacterium]|nr:ABC transporter ATP-binding protein [Hyphomicrobiaceae bacterium]